MEYALGLIVRKIPMPYTSMTGPEYFELPALLERDRYANDLGVMSAILDGEEGAALTEPISELKYNQMLETLNYFTARGKIREGAGGQGDWHDGYLATDVRALADGMESIREAWHRDLGLDLAPLHDAALGDISGDAEGYWGLDRAHHRCGWW